MDRRYLALILLAASLCAFALADRRAPAEAAEGAAASAAAAPIQAIAYASGLTGFFDPQTKRLYLYASDVKTPFMTAEIEELGNPLKIIKAPSQ